MILEADKRGGLFTPDQDAFGRFHVNHEEVRSTDWTGHIHGWLEQVIEQRGSMGHPIGDGYGHPHDYGHGHHDEHDQRGPGMGGMVAGAALGAGAGVLGGMVAGEMIEEVFEGDDEEG